MPHNTTNILCASRRLLPTFRVILTYYQWHQCSQDGYSQMAVVIASPPCRLRRSAAPARTRQSSPPSPPMPPRRRGWRRRQRRRAARPRSPEITRDHPEITRGYPRVPESTREYRAVAEIARDCPRLPEIARDCPRLTFRRGTRSSCGCGLLTMRSTRGCARREP